MGSPSNDEIVKDNLIKSLILLYTTFFQTNPNDNSGNEYTGAPSSFQVNPTTTLYKVKTPLNNLGILLEGYSDTDNNIVNFFKIVTASGLTDKTNNPNVVAGKVTNSATSATWCPSTKSPCMYINYKNNYTYSYLPNFNVDKAAINSSNINDLCLMQYLDPVNAVTSTTEGASIKSVEFLKGLYGLYEILKSENILTLQSGGSVTITIPSEIDPPSGTGTPLLNSYKVSYKNPILSIINSSQTDTTKLADNINYIININLILNNTGFNSFIFRHVIYLYIQLFNYNILLNLYKQYSTLGYTVFNQNHDNLLNISSLLYNILLNNQTTLNSLKTSLSQNYNSVKIGSFNQNISNIQNINGSIASQKDRLTTNQNTMKNVLTFKSRINNFIISTAVILAVVIFISIYIELSSAQSGKYMGSAMILVLTIVSYITIYYIYGNTILEFFTVKNKNRPDSEAFQNPPTVSFPGGANSTVNNTAVSSNILILKDAYQDMMSKNISTLIELSSVLNYTTAYNNISDILTKETNYYSGVLDEVTNSNDKINSVSGLQNLTKIDNTYLLNLLLNIMLIITIVVISRSFLSGYNNIVPYYISIIGVILIVISIIVYLLEISKRVRTDPTKLYWRGDEKLISK